MLSSPFVIIFLNPIKRDHHAASTCFIRLQIREALWALQGRCRWRPHLFVAGTVGFDYETHTISEDPAEQTRQTFRNIENALAEVEASLADTSLYSEDKKAELMSLLDKQTQFKQQLEEEEMAWLDAQEQIELKREEYDNANA